MGTTAEKKEKNQVKNVNNIIVTSNYEKLTKLFTTQQNSNL
tara:strand:- start:328 stop:450 length:123 start_codon:yes stop_codon:yes gene_type:complete